MIRILKTMTPLSVCVVVVVSGVAGLLSGCGLGSPAAYEPSEPVNYNLGAIAGHVYGGAPPIIGATVKMYATQSVTSPSSSNNYGYGQAGLLLAEATSIDGHHGDGDDTDSNGYFSFDAADYVAACPAGQQVYITASGGNSGGGLANGNLLLMAALGSCANLYNVTGSGETYQGTTSIWVDEVTTVAAANALANFITVTGSETPFVVNISAPVANNFSDGTYAWSATNSAYQTCSGTGCNGYASFSGGVETTYANGLAHAFANAENMVNLTTGRVNNCINQSGAGIVGCPTSGGYGVIPASEINSIANALQSCVNTIGADAVVAAVQTQASGASQPQIDTITLASTSDTVYGQLEIQFLYYGVGVQTANITVPGGTTPAGLATLINNSTVSVDVTAAAAGDVVTITATNSGVNDGLGFTGTSLFDVYPSSDTSTVCGKLFNYMPAKAGTVPSNTLQAAVNLAKNPYSSAANVGNIQALPTAQTSVYTPYLTTAPADWSLSITYFGGGLYTPYNIALDANDSIYAANSGNTTITAIAPGGSFTSGTTGWSAVDGSGTALTLLRGLAADSSGNLFVADDAAGEAVGSDAGTFEYSASTGAFEALMSHANGSPSTTLDPIPSPVYLAVTRRNDVWTSYSAAGIGNTDWWVCSGSPCTYSAAAATGGVASYSDGGFSEITSATDQNNEGIAVDANQNVWVSVTGFTSSSGGTNYPGDDEAILVNGNAATPASAPVYDDSTSAGTSPYNHIKLLQSITGCNTSAYATAFDSTGNGWFTTTTLSPNINVTTPSGSLCKMTVTNTRSGRRYRLGPGCRRRWRWTATTCCGYRYSVTMRRRPGMETLAWRLTTRWPERWCRSRPMDLRPATLLWVRQSVERGARAVRCIRD